MINSTESAVQIVGKEITGFRTKDGPIYVPLKSLCAYLGVNYDSQRKKIRDGSSFFPELIPIQGKDGRKRKMLCLPLEAVGTWVSTIDPDIVHPDAIEALVSCLKKFVESSDGDESQKAAADAKIMKITADENDKERVYNCLGNLNWFLDAFLLWASEVADNDGDYFPRDEKIIKASPEEVREYVRRVRFNIRVLQAIIDASIQYGNLEKPLDKHELIELYNESLKLYRSTGDLIHGLDNGQPGLQNPDHSCMDYLCGPALDTITEFGGEIIMNFHEKIIPRKKD